MSAQLLPIRDPGIVWARYVRRYPEITITEYSAGYMLLEGAERALWLARGFDELLRQVRKQRATC
jgi:hypothetical protein